MDGDVQVSKYREDPYKRPFLAILVILHSNPNVLDGYESMISQR